LEIAITDAKNIMLYNKSLYDSPPIPASLRIDGPRFYIILNPVKF